MAGRALADTVTATWGLRHHDRDRLRGRLPAAQRRRATRSPRSGCASSPRTRSRGSSSSSGSCPGTAQAAQGISLLVFPLTFVSSGYVPVASMPGWMQPFARNQPITVMVDAVRSLVARVEHGQRASPTRPATTWSRTFVWAAAISLVFGALSIARYRKG